MSEELLSRLLRSSLVEDEVDPGLEEAVMQALTTPDLTVLRQLAGPVDLEEDIFSALQAQSASAGIQKELLAEVDLEGDIFAALDAASPRAPLRAALAEVVDLEGDIFAALDATLPRAELVAALRAPVDLEADIFTSLDLASSEKSRGEALQQALGTDVDLEAGVMGALEAKTARPSTKIRSSTAQRDIPRPATPSASRRMPWVAALVSLAAVAAMAFFVLRVGQSPSQEDAFVLADRNVAEVEDLSASATASVQVMQFEENGPTFILVDEGAAPDKAVPL